MREFNDQDKIRTGELLEHIITQRSKLKKLIQNHAQGSISETAFFKELNQIANTQEPPSNMMEKKTA
jgi:hypothetical protein